jgi:hypothetical protein
MIRRPSSAAALLSCLLAGGVAVVSSQPPTTPLPLAPLGLRGEAVFPAYEGWGPHTDGTTVLLLGYFNRNKGEALDIPIGPNNRIEPGGPDFGQPTHFRSGRQHGVFGISVPKDFGNKKLTWTIVANGHSSVVSFWTNPAYWIDFFKNPADGNEPPVIRFSPTGPTLTGPPKEPVQASLAGTVGQSVSLSLWASDRPETTVHDPNPRPGQGRGRGRGNEPEGDIIINWTKYRARSRSLSQRFRSSRRATRNSSSRRGRRPPFRRPASTGCWRPPTTTRATAAAAISAAGRRPT